jgi:hypothetical protein
VVAPPFECEDAIAGDDAADRRADTKERAQAGVQLGSAGQVPQDQVGAKVLLLDPCLRGRIIAFFEPAVGVGDLDAVQDLDRVVPARGRRRGNGRSYDLRPAFGLLPWLAFLRRALVLRFEVFFDIGQEGYSPVQAGPKHVGLSPPGVMPPSR